MIYEMSVVRSVRTCIMLMVETNTSIILVCIVEDRSGTNVLQLLITCAVLKHSSMMYESSVVLGSTKGMCLLYLPFLCKHTIFV
jgi:hypothetical protein